MEKIILIGGSSSVGKTTLARSLSERFNLPSVHLDNVTKEINDPGLEFFPGQAEFWDRPAQEIFERLVRVAETTEPYLQSWVLSWLAEGKFGIIEGEKIHPLFMEKALSLNGVMGLFLIERDRERLFQTLGQRSLRFGKLSSKRQWKVVEVNQRFGTWLQQEAERRDIPWETAQPWESLVSRVMDRLKLWGEARPSG